MNNKYSLISETKTAGPVFDTFFQRSFRWAISQDDLASNLCQSHACHGTTDGTGGTHGMMLYARDTQTIRDFCTDCETATKDVPGLGKSFLSFTFTAKLQSELNLSASATPRLALELRTIVSQPL